MRRKQRVLSTGTRRAALVGLGPVVAALVGVLTNLITSTWNWWLFTVLVLLVIAAAGLVVWSEGRGGYEKDAAGGASQVSAGPQAAPGPAALASAEPARRTSMVPPRSRRFVDRPDLMAALIQRVMNQPLAARSRCAAQGASVRPPSQKNSAGARKWPRAFPTATCG